MIKKLLLMVALVASLFSSAEANIEMDTESKGRIVIKFDNFHLGTKDWIGIYKHGASNDWDNVQFWTWIDKTAEDDHDKNIRHTGSVGLEGIYDIRYFRNNSFTVYKSITVDLTDYQGFYGTPKISFAYLNSDFVSFFPSYGGEKSWVGLYKKGTSNSWNNVLGWCWVSPGSPMHSISFGHGKLSGDYELRLFYHNSYNLEAVASFFVEGDNQPEISRAVQYKDEFLFNTTTSGKGHKDWVALFKVGASSTWENVQAWSWVDADIDNINAFGKGFSIAHLAAGEYEFRLFYNNSYKVEATKRVKIEH